jgi:DNA topoisomerase-6 subunit A
MRFPLRNLSNVRFDAEAGMFKIGRKSKERTLAVGTVKTFAQSLKLIVLAKRLIETDDIATKREAYYVAKGWDEEVRFGEQN